MHEFGEGCAGMFIGIVKGIRGDDKTDFRTFRFRLIGNKDAANPDLKAVSVEEVYKLPDNTEHDPEKLWA